MFLKEPSLCEKRWFCLTKNQMKIEVHLLSQSSPIAYKNIKNAYTKDGLYCVFDEKNNVVYKYPLVNIFRIIESYLE